MTKESIKGLEFITFEQKNADEAPELCTVLPFTRNVFDPMDFTPMAFDLSRLGNCGTAGTPIGDGVGAEDLFFRFFADYCG